MPDNLQKNSVELRASVSEAQAELLQQRLSALPFRLNYGEEQRGSGLVAVIVCTVSQEKTVRELLHELGATVSAQSGDSDE